MYSPRRGFFFLLLLLLTAQHQLGAKGAMYSLRHSSGARRAKPWGSKECIYFQRLPSLGYQGQLSSCVCNIRGVNRECQERMQNKMEEDPGHNNTTTILSTQQKHINLKRTKVTGSEHREFRKDPESKSEEKRDIFSSKFIYKVYKLFLFSLYGAMQQTKLLLNRIWEAFFGKPSEAKTKRSVMRKVTWPFFWMHSLIPALPFTENK